jgi:hypothetical protein
MTDTVTAPKALDVSSEAYRIYTYSDGGQFRIDCPVELFIVGGSHRVVDADGVTHRPERGFVGISWKPFAGAPAFVA